jgi:DNA-binding transcriptional MerR regulator
MAHPFSKLFDAALRKSTPQDNRLLKEAELLRAKGYSVEEIHGVLLKMQQGLVRDRDQEIAQEAVEEISRYL